MTGVTLIPQEEMETLRHATEKAARLAGQGNVEAGYGCLLLGKRMLAATGTLQKPWGRMLEQEWELALGRFATQHTLRESSQ
jgi:hypothetical protein